MNSRDLNEMQPLILGRSFKSTPNYNDQRVLTEGRHRPTLNLPIGDDVFKINNGSHLITIASNSAEKDRSVIIPNLLTYTGSVVVIDPSGEKYAITARARREMGHTVLRLDPFRVINQDSDSLNPFDLITADSHNIESDCQVVADLLIQKNSFSDFWENSAFGLLCGVVGYIASVPEKRNFTGLINTFDSDDVVYNLAVALDTIGKRIPPLAYREIVSFLQRDDLGRSRVLATISQHLKALMSKEVLKTLDSSSVPLTDIIKGKPLSIYLIIPPAKLRSHSLLLRLWIGTLLHCITNRRDQPSQRTLFILDQCAQLDTFAVLEEAITVCRGNGLQIWMFWQDLSQIRNLYPVSWPTMINNCGGVQFFGTKDYSACSEAAALLGVEPDNLLLLEPDEQIVRLNGICHKIKKSDYLADPMFAGRFDDNPWHTHREKA